jgi:hypothetical protein
MTDNAIKVKEYDLYRAFLNEGNRTAYDVPSRFLPGFQNLRVLDARTKKLYNGWNTVFFGDLYSVTHPDDEEALRTTWFIATRTENGARHGIKYVAPESGWMFPFDSEEGNLELVDFPKIADQVMISGEAAYDASHEVIEEGYPSSYLPLYNHPRVVYGDVNEVTGTRKAWFLVTSNAGSDYGVVYGTSAKEIGADDVLYPRPMQRSVEILLCEVKTETKNMVEFYSIM